MGALIAVNALAGWQYVTLVSPLFVALLLTKVSGVPLLEQRANRITQSRQLLAEQRESTTLNAALSTLKKKAIAVREELTEKDIELESTDRLNRRLAELATVLGVCETTVWRINPPYYWVGKRKRYRLQEVLDFMQEQQP